MFPGGRRDGVTTAAAELSDAEVLDELESPVLAVSPGGAARRRAALWYPEVPGVEVSSSSLKYAGRSSSLAGSGCFLPLLDL